jgi:hypothetical protein
MVDGAQILYEIGSLYVRLTAGASTFYNAEIPRGVKAAEMSAEGKSIYAVRSKKQSAAAMSNLRGGPAE